MTRKQQFKDALVHMNIMIKKSKVTNEDAQYLFDAGVKLLLTFEDTEKGRAKWKARAEAAEKELKDATI